MEAASDDEDEDSDKDFDYLMGMPMWSLTYEKVEALKEEAADKKAQLEHLEGMSLEEMYNEDLEEVEAVYEDWSVAMEKEEIQMGDGRGEGEE